jgi:tetratricopeptide (TPR) repeat protein
MYIFIKIVAKYKAIFAKKEPTTREQITKVQERNIQLLYDQSILDRFKGNLQEAREKAFSAYEKLFELKNRNIEYFNTELEFGIKLNLALIFEDLKDYDSAKQYYNEILQQDNYYTQGIQYQRVRVNLGNIYYEQGEYVKAITEWKKASDKISKENKELRANIIRNIATAYIKIGKYEEAIDNYADSVKHNPDMKTAMNLLLCDLAIDRKEQTKQIFNSMLDVCSVLVNNLN